MTDCIKVRLKNKKIWILVLGYPLKSLLNDHSLVFEIIKTIGQKMNIDYMKNSEEFHELDIENEHPDFVVRLKDGIIEVIDII